MNIAPAPCPDFSALNELIETCYVDQSNIRDLRPPRSRAACASATSSPISAKTVRMPRASSSSTRATDESPLVGKLNHQIIQNITRNIIKRIPSVTITSRWTRRSLPRLTRCAENYEKIYKSDGVSGAHHVCAAHDGAHVHDLSRRYSHGSRGVTLFRHYLTSPCCLPYSFELEFVPRTSRWDYIASMTDDYFVDLYAFLFLTTAHSGSALQELFLVPFRLGYNNFFTCAFGGVHVLREKPYFDNA